MAKSELKCTTYVFSCKSSYVCFAFTRLRHSDINRFHNSVPFCQIDVSSGKWCSGKYLEKKDNLTHILAYCFLSCCDAYVTYKFGLFNNRK